MIIQNTNEEYEKLLRQVESELRKNIATQNQLKVQLEKMQLDAINNESVRKFIYNNYNHLTIQEVNYEQDKILFLNEISGLNKQNYKLVNDVKRAKIKIKQLNNEILSLNKRLKKRNKFFEKLIIDKGISITYIYEDNFKEKEKNKKHIKEYNDSSWAFNYNTLFLGNNKQKEKNNGKNNNSNNAKKNIIDSKSKTHKASINKLNKNKMHINYINKIQKNMSNIMNAIHEQNEYLSPYDLNQVNSSSFKKDFKKQIKTREKSPPSKDKLKYTTINQNNNKNKTRILLNQNGNIEKIKLYKKIKDYHKLFDGKLGQITRNIIPKSIRRSLSAFQNIRNSSPNFYDSYRHLCSNNIKNINQNSNMSLKRKTKYKQLNSSNSNNYYNISENSNQKKSIIYFRKKTPHRVNSQRKEITPNIKINNHFHNFYSNSSSKTMSRMKFNDNLKSSIDNSNYKKITKKINISNVSNLSAQNINNFNSYNTTKDIKKVHNLINNDNQLKNINKISNNNNITDGMLNNVLIIANIKNKFELNTVSHGANKHSSFKKFKYNFSSNSASNK